MHRAIEGWVVSGRSMSAPVICAYARTPVGKFRGSLSQFSAVELGIMAVKELCKRLGIDPAEGVVDQVYMGQVLQAGVRAGTGSSSGHRSRVSGNYSLHYN